MSATHSRRRFRDIAALIDHTEGESQTTATTSLVERTIQKERSIAIEGNKNENNLSFSNQLKNQRDRIQHNHQERQEQTPSEDGASVTQPYLTAFLLKQRLHVPPSDYADSNVALDGEEKHDDSRSQTYSSADLSMEAEAGKVWGGSTAQRFHTSAKRIQSGSLFQGRFHSRLRARFGGSLGEEAPGDESSSSSSSIHAPTETKHQLVLNATESTDSCTLSYSTTNHSAYDDHQSPFRKRLGMDLSYELPSPERPMDEPPSFPLDEFPIERPVDEPPSFRLDESPIERPVDEPRSFRLDESSSASNFSASDPEVIPSWKLEQRRKMRARMQEPGSPSTEVPPRTPPRFSEEATAEEQTPEAAPALVTPPPPPEVSREPATSRAKRFRRTFRHRAALRRITTEQKPVAAVEADEGSISTPQTPPEPPSPGKSLRNRAALRRNRAASEASAEAGPQQEPAALALVENDSGSAPHEPPVPPSPVARLRNLFETPTQSAREADSPLNADTTRKSYMNNPSIHQSRRRNHRVLSYPRRSLSKDPDEAEGDTGHQIVAYPQRSLPKDQDGTEDDTGHEVVAFPPSYENGQSIPTEQPGEDEDENDETEEVTDSENAASLEPSSEPTQPSTWWIQMKERVDRYHRTVLGKSSSRDCNEDLRKTLEGFAKDQNQLGRAMAVALFRGMELARPNSDEDRDAAHAREIQELREKHETEMRELRQQLLATKPARAVGSSVANAGSRNEAFRQRWKNRMKSKDGIEHNDPADAASTVVSNMSCRELSVERYRARILQQMNRGKRAPSLAAASVSTLNLTDDGASEVSASPSEASNKKNAHEIQRLLDELQQAERRQKLLEKQLQQAGVVLAEDIPYQLAKDKVATISQRMNEIGSPDVVHEDPLVQKQLREEYFRLEKDMEKFMTALLLTDEFAEEQRLKEEEWESKNSMANHKALEAVRRHMPVDIRTLTPQQLEEDRGLSKVMVQKFRRTNVLQLLRVDPALVAKWHPSTLEAFRVTGLTLTERRALHCYLASVAEAWKGGATDPMTTRKLAWYTTMRSNFKEALTRYEQHVGGSDGGPRRHIHSTCLRNSCELVGNQCPVRANKAIDYLAGDGGFPSGDVYEAPRIVVGLAEQQSQRSPAEVIAAARGLPNPSVSATTRAVQPPTGRPKHPMAGAKPGGLLAAIAARRID